MTTITPTTVTPPATTIPTTITPTTTTTAAATAPLESAKAKTTLNSDFETFLKMLTAQMQNQDPLNPMDSSEYAAQLAAFSSVEQQVKTNDLLKDLSTQFGGLGMAQMAHWVGMEAKVDAPAYFTGSAVEVIPKFEPLAETAVMVVKDKDGTEVQRLTVDPTKNTASWSGIASDGTTFASGLYSFSVESYAADKLLKSHPAEVYTGIKEIQNQSGTISLVLDGDTKVGASAVTALRQP